MWLCLLITYIFQSKLLHHDFGVSLCPRSELRTAKRTNCEIELRRAVRSLDTLRLSALLRGFPSRGSSVWYFGPSESSSSSSSSSVCRSDVCFSFDYGAGGPAVIECECHCGLIVEKCTQSVKRAWNTHVSPPQLLDKIYMLCAYIIRCFGDACDLNWNR